jgi:hypothetical protein
MFIEVSAVSRKGHMFYIHYRQLALSVQSVVKPVLEPLSHQSQKEQVSSSDTALSGPLRTIPNAEVSVNVLMCVCGRSQEEKWGLLPSPLFESCTTLPGLPVKKYHRLGGLINRNLFSCTSKS